VTPKGRRVFLVSASPEQIVRPIGRHIGVTEIIATRIKTDTAGFFLPEVEFYAMGQGKVDAMAALAEREDLDLAGSFAYSDSATDVPMMEMVGHPVAVNPEKDLRRMAEERDWPILEFQRPVSLQSPLRENVPLISGATVGVAVLAALIAIVLLRKKGTT